MAEVVQSARKGKNFLLTAWVFLPDHWHAIIFPRYPLTISQMMEHIKVQSTLTINARRGATGQLWQARFFDRALRTVKEYHDSVRYIQSNPVKRGLAAGPEDWKWSSLSPCGSGSSAVLPVDLISLPADLDARL